MTFWISTKDNISHRKGKGKEMKTKAVLTCVLWWRFCWMKWLWVPPDWSFSLYSATFGTSCPSSWHFHLQNYNSHTAKILLTPHSRLWPCLQQYCLRNAAKGSLQSGWCPLKTSTSHSCKLHHLSQSSLFCRPPFAYLSKAASLFSIMLLLITNVLQLQYTLVLCA